MNIIVITSICLSPGKWIPEKSLPTDAMGRKRTRLRRGSTKASAPQSSQGKIISLVNYEQKTLEITMWWYQGISGTELSG